ncbi:MAG: shikimate kinase [bacterium]|nr:shikimate kinase [bacterium]
MGSGKTTLGKKLAPLLNYPFIDLDAFIEKKEKTSIPLLFRKWGEDYFRELESKYLLEAIQSSPSSVLSLGGGTVCNTVNLSLIKTNGLLIYIDLPVSVLADRIRDSKTERPLLQNLRDSELNHFIEEKLQERKPFYDQAHIKINGLNLNSHYILQIISAFVP